MGGDGYGPPIGGEVVMGHRYGAPIWGAGMGEVVMGYRYGGGGYGAPIGGADVGEVVMGCGYGGSWLWGIDMGR